MNQVSALESDECWLDFSQSVRSQCVCHHQSLHQSQRAMECWVVRCSIKIRAYYLQWVRSGPQVRSYNLPFLYVVRTRRCEVRVGVRCIILSARCEVWGVRQWEVRTTNKQTMTFRMEKKKKKKKKSRRRRRDEQEVRWPLQFNGRIMTIKHLK